jgi:hypothetical protein
LNASFSLTFIEQEKVGPADVALHPIKQQIIRRVIKALAGLEVIRELAAIRDPDALGEEGVSATVGAVAGRRNTTQAQISEV